MGILEHQEPCTVMAAQVEMGEVGDGAVKQGSAITGSELSAQEAQFMGDCSLPKPGCLQWARAIPVLGLLYFILIEGTPTMAGVTTLLNTVALIVGLLVAGSSTMPSWISHDDLVAMDARFKPGGVWECWDPEEIAGKANYSVILGRSIFDSNIILFTALFTAVIAIIGLSTIDRTPQGESQEALGVWWRSGGAMNIFAIIVMAVVGVVYFFSAMARFALYNFPIDWLAEYCRDNPTTNPEWYDAPAMKALDPYLVVMFFGILIPFVIIFTLGQQYGESDDKMFGRAQRAGLVLHHFEGPNHCVMTPKRERE